MSPYTALLNDVSPFIKISYTTKLFITMQICLFTHLLLQINWCYSKLVLCVYVGRETHVVLYIEIKTGADPFSRKRFFFLSLSWWTGLVCLCCITTKIFGCSLWKSVFWLNALVWQQKKQKQTDWDGLPSTSIKFNCMPSLSKDLLN